MSEKLHISQKVLDNVSVAASGSESSTWFRVGPHRRVRVVESGSGANVTYKIEGSPDGGVTAYEIQTAAAGAAVDLYDPWIRVTADNAGAGAETANAWLVAL